MFIKMHVAFVLLNNNLNQIRKECFYILLNKEIYKIFFKFQISYYLRVNEQQREATDVSSSSITPRVPKTRRKEPYMCNKCGRVLSSASSYYVHMKQHSGHKPYRCTECPATFCRKPYLEVKFFYSL